MRLQKVATKTELVRVCLGSAVQTGALAVQWCDQPLFSLGKLRLEGDHTPEQAVTSLGLA
jgi:hypothetical protein